MHLFYIFQRLLLLLLTLCGTCCNVFSINAKTKLLVFWFSPLRLHSAALNLTITKMSLTVTVCVWIVLCSGCPVTSPIAGVNINERGRGFPLNTKGEEARKRRRRRMRGGIVAVGCFASCLIFSLWPCSPRGGKVGLPPSLSYLYSRCLPLSFFKSVKPWIISFPFTVLLLPSLPVTLRPSIFATLHCFSQLFCLHLHPPSPSSILLSALSLSVKHYRSPLRPSIASRSGPIVVWSWLEPEIRSDPAAVISRRRPSLLTDNLLLSGNTQKNLPLHLFSTVMRLHHTDAAAAGGKYIRGT